MKNRAIAIIIIGIATTSLGGCAKLMGSKAIDIPLVPQLSENEVVDYYKEQLSFDTISSKNLNVQDIKYETREVSNERKEDLVELVGKIEKLLGKTDYVYTKETGRILDEDTFHYMKAVLNDKSLTEGKVVKVDEALGYYFVDVEYKVGAGHLGQFKPASSLLGIHGAFEKDYDGTDRINDMYMVKSVNTINGYYRENKDNKQITYDKFSKLLGIVGSSKEQMDFTETTVQERVSVDNGTVVGEGEAVAPVAQEPEPVVNKVSARKAQINTREFNRIAGSSSFQSAYMPHLGHVFKEAVPKGTISGSGFYPAGGGGLRLFGYDREQITGRIVIRYVFKSDVFDPSITTGVNVYPVISEVLTGVNADMENVKVPNFLITEFEKLIDRADRAIANTDLAALMSGDIYSDIGVGILNGYKDNYSNILRNISTVRRVLARDIDKNAYLLEVETIRQEGPKNIDTYGTYREKSYVTVEQVGNKFIITDQLVMLSNITKEPSINPDSTITKRLVALNLAGPVSDESKEGINQLMADLYKAGSYRVLNGPREVQSNGTTLTIERGLYDCFNDDTAMLPADKKEYINATIREMLVRHGVDVGAEYTGAVVEWIGGADNQVEFTTEEIITYEGRGNGRYMEVYYLASKMNDVWVIDDMKIVELEEKTGAELEQIEQPSLSDVEVTE